MDHKNVTYIDELFDVSEDYVDTQNHQNHGSIRKNNITNLQFENQNHGPSFIENESQYKKIPQPPPPPPTEKPMLKESEELNCVNICNHIKNCPVCNRLYNSNDKTIYIIIIIILGILCLLLLKRVLKL